MESQHWDCCRDCLKHLDDGPKWRPSKSHKLLCDDCAASGRYGLSMTKQFDWSECMVCWEPFPDYYFTCRSRQGHALCSSCVRRLLPPLPPPLQRGKRGRFIKTCPKCKARPKWPVKAVACTFIKIPDEDEPVEAQNEPVGPHIGKEVLNVRLGKSLNDRQVRIRWGDTWETFDSMVIDRWKQVKSIIEVKPESIKVRWKDSWEPLESLEGHPLKELAMWLLEDKYSV